MINYLLVAGMSLFAQIPMIAAGWAMDSILENEESALELIDVEDQTSFVTPYQYLCFQSRGLLLSSTSSAIDVTGDPIFSKLTTK